MLLQGMQGKVIRQSHLESVHDRVDLVQSEGFLARFDITHKLVAAQDCLVNATASLPFSPTLGSFISWEMLGLQSIVQHWPRQKPWLDASLTYP